MRLTAYSRGKGVPVGVAGCHDLLATAGVILMLLIGLFVALVAWLVGVLR